MMMSLNLIFDSDIKIMRAIIKIKFYNTESYEESLKKLEDFLRLEGFNILSLASGDSTNSNNEVIKDRISSLIGSLAKSENQDIITNDYIFTNGGIEGLVVLRKNKGLRLVVYKHNLVKLQDICYKLSNSFVDYFNKFEKPGPFSVNTYIKNAEIEGVDIREDGMHKNLMVGRVSTTRRTKLHKVKQVKSFEYKAGLILLAAIISAISFSAWANITNGFRVDRLNNWLEYAVTFSERLLSPMIVTSSLLWFNFFSYRTKFLKNRIVIDWD